MSFSPGSLGPRRSAGHLRPSPRPLAAERAAQACRPPSAERARNQRRRTMTPAAGTSSSGSARPFSSSCSTLDSGAAATEVASAAAARQHRLDEPDLARAALETQTRDEWHPVRRHVGHQSVGEVRAGRARAAADGCAQVLVGEVAAGAVSVSDDLLDRPDQRRHVVAQEADLLDDVAGEQGGRHRWHDQQWAPRLAARRGPVQRPIRVGSRRRSARACRSCRGPQKVFRRGSAASRR